MANQLEKMQEALRVAESAYDDVVRASSYKPLDGELYTVIFTALVTVTYAGIGVEIYDTKNRCVFELGKPCRRMEVEVVELFALGEALCAALTLRLRRVHISCDSHSVCQYLTGERRPSNTMAMRLVDELIRIKKIFGYLGPFLVGKNVYVHSLARDAIADKTSPAQCTICFDAFYDRQMFIVNKCLHKYCFSCMKKYAKAKLLQGRLPKCPHDKCRNNLDIESCKEFLDQELYDIMSSRIKEASIPPTEKVYCPFSNCSAMMSIYEVQEYSAISSQENGMRKCVECQSLFCINCKVPWHDNMTCTYYSKKYTSSNDKKLKSLATRKRWRECIKCKNIVELASGCYHIYCRCGCEFCYTCGAEWINKTPTCRCTIWDERNDVKAKKPLIKRIMSNLCGRVD